MRRWTKTSIHLICYLICVIDGDVHLLQAVWLSGEDPWCRHTRGEGLCLSGYRVGVLFSFFVSLVGCFVVFAAGGKRGKARHLPLIMIATASAAKNGMVIVPEPRTRHPDSLPEIQAPRFCCAPKGDQLASRGRGVEKVAFQPGAYRNASSEQRTEGHLQEHITPPPPNL